MELKKSQEKHTVWMPDVQDVPLFEKLKAFLLRSSLIKVMKSAKKKVNEVRFLDVGCGFKANMLTSLAVLKNNTNLGGGGSLSGIDFVLDTEHFEKEGLIPISSDAISALSTMEQNSQDVITFLSIFEHLDMEERKKVARLARHVLAQNGILYINVPSWFGKFILEDVVLRFFDSQKNYQKQVDTHKTYFSKASMWQMLIDVGFVSSEIKVSRSNFFCSVTAIVTKKKINDKYKEVYIDE